MNDISKCTIQNDVDENGNPTGGYVSGVGLSITWQNGPLGRDADRKEPNGAFVETTISAAKQRLEFYETASNGRFAHEKNAEAIFHLNNALRCCEERTREREARQVEGTHTA